MKIIGKIIAVILLCTNTMYSAKKSQIDLSKEDVVYTLSGLSCSDKNPWTVEIVDEKTDKLLKQVIFKCKTYISSFEYDPAVAYTIYAFKGDVSKQPGYQKDTPWIKNNLSTKTGYFPPVLIPSGNFAGLDMIKLRPNNTIEPIINHPKPEKIKQKKDLDFAELNKICTKKDVLKLFKTDLDARKKKWTYQILFKTDGDTDYRNNGSKERAIKKDATIPICLESFSDIKLVITMTGGLKKECILKENNTLKYDSKNAIAINNQGECSFALEADIKTQIKDSEDAAFANTTTGKALQRVKKLVTH